MAGSKQILLSLGGWVGGLGLIAQWDFLPSPSFCLQQQLGQTGQTTDTRADTNKPSPPQTPDIP